MKKKRCYEAGAVFEICHGVYILSQVGNSVYALISLENGSNRWSKPIGVRPGQCYISDNKVRKMIGKYHGSNSNKVREYKYLGQFNEVFEQMGR